MTADYVAHHAAEHPDKIAVIAGGRPIPFSALSRDIGRVMSAIRALGLRPGASVAVGTDDLYMHWLLLLGCERLGIGAVSFEQGQVRGLAGLLASVDLVFADAGWPIAGAKRVQPLAQAWTESVLAAPPEGEPLPVKGPDDPVRIITTSGTTGIPKCFLVTRRMHDALCTQWQSDTALGPDSRYLQTLPLAIRGTFDLGSACLRFGGTLVLETRMTAFAALSAHAITHAILLPITLKGLLDQLPADFVKPRELAIVSFGAAVSDALRERAMAKLATSLYDLYGAVETGTTSAISRSGRDGYATLLPEAQAEIVDENDRPVPWGMAGRIRIRTAYMSERYLGDDEATARLFRGGWFYPGDIGTIREGRELKILGRADDMVNLGGTKFLAAVLEEMLVKNGVAGDVGVCSLPNAEGIDELWIGIAEVTSGDERILERTNFTFRNLHVGTFHMVKLDRIPRSANGKLQRQTLRETFASRRRAPSV